MVGFPPGIARCRRLAGVFSLAMAIGLLVAACGPAPTAATGAATAHGTATPSSSASPPRQLNGRLRLRRYLLYAAAA